MALIDENDEKFFYVRSLATRVLCVATVNKVVGDWSAYVDAVIGYNAKDEYPLVCQHGDKLPYEIAKYLFGFLDRKYLWRD